MKTKTKPAPMKKQTEIQAIKAVDKADAQRARECRQVATKFTKQVLLNPALRSFLDAIVKLDPAGLATVMKVATMDRDPYLNAFIQIIEEHTGCTSPAEDFIIHLALIHTHKGLTPEDAEDAIADFRQNIEEYRETVVLFKKHYPKEFAKVASDTPTPLPGAVAVSPALTVHPTLG